MVDLVRAVSFFSLHESLRMLLLKRKGDVHLHVLLTPDSLTAEGRVPFFSISASNVTQSGADSTSKHSAPGASISMLATTIPRGRMHREVFVGLVDGRVSEKSEVLMLGTCRVVRGRDLGTSVAGESAWRGKFEVGCGDFVLSHALPPRRTFA